MKTKDDENSSIPKKISKQPQSNQNIGKPGFSGTGGISVFTFDRNDDDTNQYNYEIPDDQ